MIVHINYNKVYTELNLVDAHVASSSASPIFFNARKRKIGEAGDEGNAHVQVLTLSQHDILNKTMPDSLISVVLLA